MLTETLPYCQSLADGLVLKSVVNRQDVERLAAFNAQIHGPGVADMTRQLLLHHPRTRPEHWLFVEDEAQGQVVSSLCLIPWTWKYENVSLEVAEMGIVGTLPSFRRRGLVRALAARFDALSRAEGYDLCAIQGIPYFYRQFGYAYALPLEGGWRLELYLALKEKTQPYTFFPAALSDIPLLVKLYDRAARGLSVYVVRKAQVWQYLLGPSQDTEMRAETWLVRTPSGQVAGYFRVPAEGFGEGLIVNEVSRLDAPAARAVLRWLAQRCVERDKPYLRLNLPANCALVQVARGLGAHDLGTYAWQIKGVDVPRLLEKLGPVLQRRISASPFAGLTQRVCLSFYRQAFDLCFEQGKLHRVETVVWPKRWDLRMPSLQFMPLLLGYRSCAELCDADHDVAVKRERQYVVNADLGVVSKSEYRPLIDVLFPKVSSFIYTTY